MTQNLKNKRYNIIEEIHSGAQGCVYLAFDTKLDEQVAMKEMLERYSEEDEKKYALRRFKEEAQILFTLEHPALPRVTDYFTENGKYYLVMSLVKGKDLQSLMEERDNRPLSPRRVENLARQILEVLDYLHSFNPPIIYRDIKPSNLMVDENDNIFMVDFGIARLFEKERKGTSIGTPGFSPPEQYKGFTEPRSDLFSLGATLHYLLTGIDPADPNNPPFTFDDIKKYNPEIPERFLKLINWLLGFTPEKRPESAKKALLVLNGDEQFPGKEEKTKPAKQESKGVTKPLTKEKKFSPVILIPLIIIVLLIMAAIFNSKTKRVPERGMSSSTTPAVKKEIDSTPVKEENKEEPTANFPTTKPRPVDIPGFLLKPDSKYGWVSHFALSGDGKMVAAAYPYGKIPVWDVKNRKVIKWFHGHKDRITTISFSQDGKYMVSGCEFGRIVLWDLKNEKKAFKTDTPEGVLLVGVSPDNKSIHYTDYKNVYRRINLNGKVIDTYRGTCFDISPDGKYIVINNVARGFIFKDLNTGWHKQYQFSPIRWIRKLKFSPDGKQVAIATSNHRIYIVDLKQNKIAKEIVTPVNFVMAIDYSPNGKYLAASLVDETIAVWDLSNDKLIQRLRPSSFFREMGAGHSDDIYWTPDGSYLVFTDLINVRFAEAKFSGK